MPVLVFGILFLFFVPIFLLLVKKREKYFHKLLNERNTVKRTGLFAEIYEEYKHDGFEFNLIYDKLEYQEYFNNYIGISLIKNNHEFLISIDEHSIYITVDKETDEPKMKDFYLSQFSSVEEVYAEIQNFIFDNS